MYVELHALLLGALCKNGHAATQREEVLVRDCADLKGRRQVPKSLRTSRRNWAKGHTLLQAPVASVAVSRASIGTFTSNHGCKTMSVSRACSTTAAPQRSLAVPLLPPSGCLHVTAGSYQAAWELPDTEPLLREGEWKADGERQCATEVAGVAAATPVLSPHMSTQYSGQ